MQDNFLKKNNFSTKEKKINQDFYEDLNFFRDNEDINFNMGEINFEKNEPNLMKNKNQHMALELEI